MTGEVAGIGGGMGALALEERQAEHEGVAGPGGVDVQIPEQDLRGVRPGGLARRMLRDSAPAPTSPRSWRRPPTPSEIQATTPTASARPTPRSSTIRTAQRRSMRLDASLQCSARPYWGGGAPVSPRVRIARGGDAGTSTKQEQRTLVWCNTVARAYVSEHAAGRAASPEGREDEETSSGSAAGRPRVPSRVCERGLGRGDDRRRVPGSMAISAVHPGACSRATTATACPPATAWTSS